MEQVRVIVSRGQTAWVAQGLEYDVAAQGPTVHDAMLAWVKTFVCEVARDLRAGKQPLETVPRAPQRFFALWEGAEARPSFEVPRPSDFACGNIPPSWMINKFTPDTRIVVS